jgi:hypothetical protein
MLSVNDAGEPTSVPISETLAQRGTRYGEFSKQAELSQALYQTLMRHYFTVHSKAEPLPPYIVEALAMICHKLARIANGDPFYDDNYRDISGYSQLVVEELNKRT